MDIHVPLSKENITSGGQRAEHTDPKIVLKEGKVVQASVLARQDQQMLLKIADLLVRAETEGARPQALLQQALQLKVESFQADRIVLTAVQKPLSDTGAKPALPDVKINFTVNQADQSGFSKLQISPGQTVAAKLITENQQVFLKIADQTVLVKPELTSFEGRNIPMVKSGTNTFAVIQNNVPAASTAPVPAATQAPASEQAAIKESGSQQPAAPAVNQAANLGILKEMIKSEQVFQHQQNSNTNTQPSIVRTESPTLTAGQLPQTVVIRTPPVPAAVVDQFIQAGSTSKELPAELKAVRQLVFETDAKTPQPLPATLLNKTTQEVVSFDRVSLQSNTQLVEATIDNQKILLKPDLEFKNQAPLFLKYSKNAEQIVLTVDPQSSQENRQLLQQLHFKLGQVIVEDENNTEIIKRIIENKLPLTQENIKTIQNFIQASPIDARSSIDLLINQNLLLGIFYQLQDLNDKFLLKGMQKKNKRNKKMTDYEFTILYESETLGDILIELIWSDHLKISFYCADQVAYDKIISTSDQLKESLTVKNITIHAEVNKEYARKEPVSSDEIKLSNLDIKI